MVIKSKHQCSFFIFFPIIFITAKLIPQIIGRMKKKNQAVYKQQYFSALKVKNKLRHRGLNAQPSTLLPSHFSILQSPANIHFPVTTLDLTCFQNPASTLGSHYLQNFQNAHGHLLISNPKIFKMKKLTSQVRL